ncbi:16S rRNA m(7)G-527 methyltransferase [Alteromonadaceae bacterium Bs31]|nr:16S rRNA m(7)G-527 methyltransferase [Alteromonadaceae bacterium Bs31]
MSKPALYKQLSLARQVLSIPLEEPQLEQLWSYFELFSKWNKTYNLSAIREGQDIITKHLLDSLSIAPYIEGTRFIDVGTGGGLPGIPLAIAFPERHFTLLDSAGKKTRFLFQVKQALKLDNVQIENRRVESFAPQPLYDGVVSRAFASLKDMCSCCQHLIKEDGKFFAMKGVFPDHELSELEKHYIVDASHQLQVPGLEGERCLVVLRRQKTQ